MITTSPAQRDAEAARDSFFNRMPISGPQLPRESNIRESPVQAARRAARERFFEPKTLRPSSLQRTAEAFMTNEASRSVMGPVTGGKTKNEALGTDFKLIIQDCEGTEITRLEFLRGAIQNDEEEVTIRAGCDGSSSYPV